MREFVLGVKLQVNCASNSEKKGQLVEKVRTICCVTCFTFLVRVSWMSFVRTYLEHKDVLGIVSQVGLSEGRANAGK